LAGFLTALAAVIAAISSVLNGRKIEAARSAGEKGRENIAKSVHELKKKNGLK